MRVMSLGMVAGLAGLAFLSGSAAAAPAPVTALTAKATNQTLIEPVHYRYRCWVKRCGPYRCFWFNRCRW
jgi:hypothetical protein